MTELAKILGRVMMTAVRLPRPTEVKEEGFRKYTETEFGRDSAYVRNACSLNHNRFDPK